MVLFILLPGKGKQAKMTNHNLPPSIIMHSYGGTAGMIDSLLALKGLGNRFYFSFSYVINMRAPKTVDVIRAVPDDRLLIETDQDTPTGMWIHHPLSPSLSLISSLSVSLSHTHYHTPLPTTHTHWIFTWFTSFGGKFSESGFFCLIEKLRHIVVFGSYHLLSLSLTHTHTHYHTHTHNHKRCMYVNEKEVKCTDVYWLCVTNVIQL